MKINSIFIMLILTLLAFNACSRANEQPAGEENLAPDFAIQTLEGEKVVLSEVLKEKKAVLEFWATECYYCVKSIPDIEEFYKENKDKVALLAISIKESEEKLKSFVRKKKISYPVALDSDGSIAKLYNVRGVPTVIVVDKDGKILYSGYSIKEMSEKVDF